MNEDAFAPVKAACRAAGRPESHSSVYRAIREGTYPGATQQGERGTEVKASEVAQFLTSRRRRPAARGVGAGASTGAAPASTPPAPVSTPPAAAPRAKGADLDQLRAEAERKRLETAIADGDARIEERERRRQQEQQRAERQEKREAAEARYRQRTSLRESWRRRQHNRIIANLGPLDAVTLARFDEQLDGLWPAPTDEEPRDEDTTVLVGNFVRHVADERELNAKLRSLFEGIVATAKVCDWSGQCVTELKQSISERVAAMQSEGASGEQLEAELSEAMGFLVETLKEKVGEKQRQRQMTLMMLARQPDISPVQLMMLMKNLDL